MKTAVQFLNMKQANQIRLRNRLGCFCKAACVMGIVTIPSIGLAESAEKKGLLALLDKPSPAVAAALAPELPSEIDAAVEAQTARIRPLVAYRELRRESTAVEPPHETTDVLVRIR